MTYKEFWDKYQVTPGFGTRWVIPVCEAPVLLFWAEKREDMSQEYQAMEDDWPGLTLYIPGNISIQQAYVPRRMEELDRRAAPPVKQTDKIPPYTLDRLDAEHWQGTPQHAQYTMGCMMEALSDSIVDMDSAEDMSKTAESVGKLAARLHTVWLYENGVKRFLDAGEEDEF